MAAPALSFPSQASAAGRRGTSAPTRPSLSISSDHPIAAPAASQQQAAALNRLIGQQQRSFAPGLNTQTNRQPAQSASTSRASHIPKRGNPLNNLLARQQQDASPSYDEGDSDSSEPDYLSMNEPEVPEQQPSVLDMANQGFSPYGRSANDTDEANEAANDNDLSPADQTTARNRAFQTQQALNQARGQQFIPQGTQASDQVPTDGSGAQPPLNIRQFGPNTDYNQQQAERWNALNRRLNPNANDEEADAENPAPALVGSAEQIRSDYKELGRLGRRVGTLFTGVGVLEAFAEQNVVVANAYVFNNSIKIPGICDRPPASDEPSTLSHWIDRANAFLLLGEYVMIPLVVIGSIILLLIAALPYLIPLLGAAYAAQLFGENGAALYTMLAN